MKHRTPPELRSNIQHRGCATSVRANLPTANLPENSLIRFSIYALHPRSEAQALEAFLSFTSKLRFPDLASIGGLCGALAHTWPSQTSCLKREVVCCRRCCRPFGSRFYGIIWSVKRHHEKLLTRDHFAKRRRISATRTTMRI